MSCRQPPSYPCRSSACRRSWPGTPRRGRSCIPRPPVVGRRMPGERGLRLRRGLGGEPCGGRRRPAIVRGRREGEQVHLEAVAGGRVRRLHHPERDRVACALGPVAHRRERAPRVRRLDAAGVLPRDMTGGRHLEQLQAHRPSGPARPDVAAGAVEAACGRGRRARAGNDPVARPARAGDPGRVAPAAAVRPQCERCADALPARDRALARVLEPPVGEQVRGGERRPRCQRDGNDGRRENGGSERFS
jgi:hypothetical protein